MTDALTAPPEDAAPVALRTVPLPILAHAEEMIRLLNDGRAFHRAQKESGLMHGQLEMVRDNAPDVYGRIEAACMAVKRTAKHVLLGEAVRQVQEGTMKEGLDREGNVRRLMADVPVNAIAKLLEGVDSDFKRTSEKEIKANSVPQVVNVFNLAPDTMLAIKMGNADIVAAAADSAMKKAKDVREGKVVDVKAKEAGDEKCR
jgi:hypothetical protein